jgi:anti-sigma factor RsiW
VNQPDFITCRELIEFLGEYVDGTLSPPMRREFERHLNVCPSCVAYVESYRRTIRMGKTLLNASSEPATDVAPESLVAAVRAARARNP